MKRRSRFPRYTAHQRASMPPRKQFRLASRALRLLAGTRKNWLHPSWSHYDQDTDGLPLQMLTAAGQALWGRSWWFRGEPARRPFLPG